MKKLVVNKVAVLGAGVMGSQIAAHFANCNHKVYLYDLPGLAKKSLLGLQKLKPSPIVKLEVLQRIIPCDYDNNLNLLSECDWVIEAVAENIEIKENLFNKVKSYISNTAVLSTNTSGLSINSLAKYLIDNNLDKRFCGVHFFNPPRYQKLVEIIPHDTTDLVLVDKLEEYLVRYLGKGVVRANDTPNFIANRIGVFSMLVTIHHALQFNIDFDVVDALTGELIGRAKSATFRTADVVGLDTLADVINTIYKKCKDDPWHSFLAVPDCINKLIATGSLGQKTKKGFYIKDKNNLSILDVKSGSYRKVEPTKLDSKLKEILKIKNLPEKFNKLRSYDHPQAQFLWACFRDLFHYTAYHLLEIANNVREVDNALKWGFGWQQGPFELWQALNWSNVANWITQDINNNVSLSNTVLPTWVSMIDKVYDDGKAYNVKENSYDEMSGLIVYKRQYTSGSKSLVEQKVVLENNDAKLWQFGTNLIFSFKTKANTINTNVLELLANSIDYISNSGEFNNLVIWQDNGVHFCAGADISGFMKCIEINDYVHMEQILKLFQDTCQKLRYANFPVVAAVKGMALGGGCELLLHCDHVVSAIESYIGLVEVGIGVIPAGGGCKEMVLRAHNQYKNLISNKLETSSDNLLQYFYNNIATAVVSSSAYDAMNIGYLRDSDTIIANSDELLLTAIDKANQLAFSNYQPPLTAKLLSGGERLEANILSVLVNYKVGEFISDHDFLVLSKLAKVITGGGVSSDFEMTEEWLLGLERKYFIELLKTSKTKERIRYMLDKNQPLRN